MALVSLNHGLLWPYGRIVGIINSNSATLDAAGEKQVLVGKLYIEGKATNKTLDTTGSSKIIWSIASNPVFDNASSEFRAGFQGIDKTTGVPVRSDGVWSVYTSVTTAADSTPTLTTTSNFHEKVPTSGTATFSHGDEVCFVCEMTARAGTDSVIVMGGQSSHYPAASAYIGAAWTAASITPTVCGIIFSDGTLGWIDCWDMVSVVSRSAVVTYTDASNPDEYGEIFQIPFDCKADALWTFTRFVDAGSDCVITLYGDPLGTPTTLASATLNAENSTGLTFDAPLEIALSSEVPLTANTNYCVAVKATGTSNTRLNSHTIYSAGFRKALGNGGTTLQGASRNNSTGAFTGSTTVHYPCGVRISQVQDGTGGGGGGPLISGRLVK